MLRTPASRCLLVIAGFVLSSASAFAQTASFTARRDFAIGYAEPQSVAVGDFNGDGVTDVAVATDGIVILLGNGDGTFQPPVRYRSVNTLPPSMSVAVGDFNGDGVPDLATANYRDSVSVFLGNGDGTFQADVTFAAGSQPKSVAVADFNGDTVLDVAVTNSGSNNVSVFLGNGDGTFQAAVFFGTNAGPVSVAVGDFNRDGTADLAVANAGSNDVSVLLGNGDGTFQPEPTFALDGSPRALAVSDLNGDAVPDLAVISDNPASSSGAVLLGNGDGTFLTAQMFDAGSNPSSVAVGDLDGDGAVDLIVGTYLGSVWVLPGNGDGSFQAAMSSATAGSPVSVVVADVNGDGQMDAVTGNRASTNGYTISILIGRGNGTFVQAPRFAAGSGGSSVVPGDFNGDGVLDLAAANSSSNDVSVLLGSGDGTFQAAGTFASGGSQPWSVAVSDFNLDGVLDLAVANYSSADYANSNVSALLGNGDGSFRLASSIAISAARSVAVGDFNGDGQADLAVGRDGIARVLLGNGDGTFRPAPSLPSFGPYSSTVVAVTDLNGDGLADVVIGDGPYKEVIVLLGNGDGTFKASRAAGVGWVLALAVGDFNADGAPDVALTTSDFMVASIVWVLPGNGDGTFQAAARYYTLGGPSSVKMGDFNGDSVVDLAVANGGANTVAVLLGTGDGTFQAQSFFGSTAGAGSLAVGDFNRDGQPDLAASGSGISVLINDTAVVPIPQSYSFTVNRQGNGGGTVTSSSNPAGATDIDCGTTCAATYASGTMVTLTAQAAVGSTFAGWSGCDEESGTTCTVTMNETKSVVASFVLQRFGLTVMKDGIGRGIVTSSSDPASSPQIDCGTICSADYDWNTVVTLRATPALGSLFLGWRGCDAVSRTTCTVTIGASRTVGATFQGLPLAFRPQF